jgi:hypothetical protein
MAEQAQSAILLAIIIGTLAAFIVEFFNRRPR